jgi:signal transduction histidine kinase
MTCV